MLTLWTGQHEGDLIRLPWSAYDGTHIRLRQVKTGERVTVPVGEPLRDLLAPLKAERRPATTIRTNARQQEAMDQ